MPHKLNPDRSHHSAHDLPVTALWQWTCQHYTLSFCIATERSDDQAETHASSWPAPPGHVPASRLHLVTQELHSLPPPRRPHHPVNRPNHPQTSPPTTVAPPP